MLVRLVTIQDFEAIYTIGLDCPELQTNPTQPFMEPEELRWAIDNPNGIFLLGENDGEPVGFIYVNMNVRCLDGWPVWSTSLSCSRSVPAGSRRSCMQLPSSVFAIRVWKRSMAGRMPVSTRRLRRFFPVRALRRAGCIAGTIERSNKRQLGGGPLAVTCFLSLIWNVVQSKLIKTKRPVSSLTSRGCLVETGHV